MARLRTRMSKIKEVLRLKFDCHLANRSISVCLNIGCSTISDVVTLLNSFDNSVSMIDLDEHKVVNTLPVDKSLNGISWSSINDKNK